MKMVLSFRCPARMEVHTDRRTELKINTNTKMDLFTMILTYIT